MAGTELLPHGHSHCGRHGTAASRSQSLWQARNCFLTVTVTVTGMENEYTEKGAAMALFWPFLGRPQTDSRMCLCAVVHLLRFCAPTHCFFHFKHTLFLFARSNGDPMFTHMLTLFCLRSSVACRCYKGENHVVGRCHTGGNH